MSIIPIERKRLLRESFLECAEEFGEIFHSKNELLKIKDIMLYGSLVRGSETPSNLDLLLIHTLPEFETFDSEIIRIKENDSYLMERASNLLSKYVDLKEMFNGTRILEFINLGLLNTRYMHTDYFTDENYRRMWEERNTDKQFTKNIFSYGTLWNQKTSRFDIPSSEVYTIN